MNPIDIRTVLFVQILVHVVGTLVLSQLWHQNRGRFAGLQFWLAAYVAQLCGVVLITLRGHVPAWISVVLSNTLVILGLLLLNLGLERFARRPGPQLHNYILVALFPAVHGYFTFVQPNLPARYMDISAAHLILSAQGAWLLLRRAEPALRRAGRGTALVLVGLCAVSTVRIVVASVGPEPGADYFQAGAVQAVILVTYLMLFVLLTFALVLLVNGRLVAEVSAGEEMYRRLSAELEQRVRARTAELEVSNRELEAFCYSVSHDLRSPLRAIDGFSGMVIEDYGGCLDAEGRRRLGVVRASAMKMNRLIDDLLAFSRSGRGDLQHAPLDMRGMVHSVFEEVVADAAARARIDFSTGELPAAAGDAALVRQVWVNLLANAVKFSAHRERPVIEVSGDRAGDEFAYHVRDNGVGFDQQYAGKLFGVFQRLHAANEYEGTGIGLALVQRIVVRHGGRTWATGTPGQGATFSFALPASAS